MIRNRILQDATINHGNDESITELRDTKIPTRRLVRRMSPKVCKLNYVLLALPLLLVISSWNFYVYFPFPKTALDRLIEQQGKLSSVRMILASLKAIVDTPSSPFAFGEAVTDPEAESERCRRYGFQYKGRKIRRRIFFGGIIADDSWHPIAAHAAEAFGLYHTVSLIESETPTGGKHIKKRKIRFHPGSLNREVLQSGIFGPSTKVSVDIYVDRPEERGPEGKADIAFITEHLQRDQILKAWKRNGMRTDDVGIVSDIDEFFTRDFLLAAQTCDIPQFRPDQDCRTPKLIGATMVFEASPECITDNRYWFHPDMMIGECIDGIGDSNLHKPPKRDLMGIHGHRKPGYGQHQHDYSLMPTTTMYPLWSPVDFRDTEGGNTIENQDKDNNLKYRHSAFHLHNFFESVSVWRRKYKTYTHYDPQAHKKRLQHLHADVNLSVNCAMNREDDRDAQCKRVNGGFGVIDGPTPLLFQDSVYRAARQQELKEMITMEEMTMME